MRAHTVEFSLEISPAESSRGVPIEQLLSELIPLEPAFITVTYGAGGTEKGEMSALRSLKVAQAIEAQGIPAVPHLTGIGSSSAQIDRWLDELATHGIDKVFAVRGDWPRDWNPELHMPGDFRYGNELIRHIEAYGGFEIMTSAYPEKHPEAVSLACDIAYLKDKIAHGATRILTQFFYINDVFYDFLSACEVAGIHDVPIVPGIMPPINLNQSLRLAHACGVSFPDDLYDLLSRYASDKQAMCIAGIQYAIAQIVDLIRHGHHTIHLFTMNRLEVIKAIVQGVRQAVVDPSSANK